MIKIDLPTEYAKLSDDTDADTLPDEPEFMPTDPEPEPVFTVGPLRLTSDELAECYLHRLIEAS